VIQRCFRIFKWQKENAHIRQERNDAARRVQRYAPEPCPTRARLRTRASARACAADHQRGKNSERINSLLAQAISVAPDQLSSLLGSCRRVRNMLFRRRLRLRKLAAEKIAHL